MLLENEVRLRTRHTLVTNITTAGSYDVTIHCIQDTTKTIPYPAKTKPSATHGCVGNPEGPGEPLLARRVRPDKSYPARGGPPPEARRHPFRRALGRLQRRREPFREPIQEKDAHRAGWGLLFSAVPRDGRPHLRGHLGDPLERSHGAVVPLRASVTPWRSRGPGFFGFAELAREIHREAVALVVAVAWEENAGKGGWVLRGTLSDDFTASSGVPADGWGSTRTKRGGQTPKANQKAEQ